MKKQATLNVEIAAERQGMAVPQFIRQDSDAYRFSNPGKHHDVWDRVEWLLEENERLQELIVALVARQQIIDHKDTP